MRHFTNPDDSTTGPVVAVSTWRGDNRKQNTHALCEQGTYVDNNKKLAYELRKSCNRFGNHHGQKFSRPSTGTWGLYRSSKSAVYYGVATLELVLSLPILLALMVGIVWLGNSVIAQTEVTIEARHKTWEKRSESSGKPLLFLKDDVVSEEATQEVDVSPLFDDADAPESSHDVMAAAWDYGQLPLDKAPNWKQYAIAAANAKTGSLQNGYVDASNKLAQFKHEASNIWSNIGAALIREITSLGDTAKTSLEGGDSASEQNKTELRNQIRRKLDSKKDELQRAKEAKRNLGEDASAALKKVAENRVKRLKADVEDLKDDLDAIDD